VGSAWETRGGVTAPGARAGSAGPREGGGGGGGVEGLEPEAEMLAMEIPDQD